MRAKSMVLILIALGCGLVASIAISQVMDKGANSGGGAVENVKICVALSDIDVNEQLTAENVGVEDWPKSKIPEGSTVDFDEIKDQFARTRMYQGEPILKRKLATQITGPAITIPEGDRVCSLSVRMETAVSYLIKPGDRVDIFGYFREGRDIPKTGTREIMRNVRVFAVNSETEQGVDADGRAIVAKTVSVLVKQDQVAKLTLAAELGTLRLVLRRPNETNDESGTKTASIESLFGSQAESGDENQAVDQATQSTASSNGGFMKFLAGLKQSGPPAATNVVAVSTQAAGPAWQMTVLTPDGGTEFTWSDENALPQEGGAEAMTLGSGSAIQPGNMGSGGGTWTSSTPGASGSNDAGAASGADAPSKEDTKEQQDDPGFGAD